MSSSGAEVSRAAPVQSHGHQPNRPISEISAKVPRVHRHHHPHLHRQDKDQKIPQSTSSSLQPGAALDVPKSEGVTPNESRSVSRRTSILGSADESALMVGQPQRWPVTEADVEAEKERAALRAVELRKSLVSLNTLSNDTAKRLDTAYYSVVEKLGVLHTTISSLKDLAQSIRSLDDEFKHESQGMVKDIETQLDAFENFRGKEKNIEKLHKRIDAGREAVQALGVRVDVVKRKVEGWERVETEWHQRTRKRLKILWAFIGITTLAFVIFLISQYTPARTQGPDNLHGIDVKNLNLGLGEKQDNKTLRLRRTTVDTLEKLRPRADAEIGDDPRLRGFDEL